MPVEVEAKTPAVYLGVPILEGSKEISSGRFKSPRNLKKTVKYYQRWAAARREGKVIKLITPPGIKVVYLHGTKEETKWEGINIYQYQRDIFYYIIERD